MAPSDTSSFFSSPFAVCVSAKAVYGWFKDGNPKVTDAGQETWGKVSGIQTEVSTLISKAVNDSGASWSGAAGDAMRSSTSPLSTWADLTGTNAQSGSSAVAEISSAFRDAQNSVQEPVSVPDKPWYNDFSPWDTDYDDAVEKSQGVDEANMRVINAYADRTNYSVSNMPTFEAPPDSTADVDDGSSENSNSNIDKLNNNEQFTNNQTSTSSTSSNNSNGSGEQVRQFTPPGGDNTGGNNNGGDDNTTRPSNTDDGTTRPSDVNDPNRPPVGTPGRPTVGVPGGIDNPPGFVPFGPNDPRNPANKLNGPGGPGSPGPGSPGAGRTGGGGGGAGGGRGGGGLGGGLGGGAGAGAGAGAGGRGGLGPGAAAAAGQFGGSAGTAAGEGGRAGAGGFGAGGAAAGGRGAAGGAGAMGGAGHGGKGEGGDDLEHSSKYLQPSDEYFGDGTMVAPPVIGG